MNTPQHLCIGLSLAATWLNGDAWCRPDSRVEALHSVDLYAELARRAESACIDFVFRPDSLFIDPATLEHGPGFSGLDPTLLMTALARETRHIGLVTTASTTFNQPYIVARQLQSLQQISAGRAGWNVVTALDGQQNFGLQEMPSADARYARAAEFTAAVRQLWRSYPAEALALDRAGGRYADSSRVRPIDFDGQHLAVQGPLSLPGHPAGEVPLFQAGASEVGREFAAQIADAIFAATPDMHSARALRADLQARTSRLGRGPGAVRVLPGLSLYLAGTRAQAQELFEAARSEQQRARKLAALQPLMQVDLSQLPADQPLGVDAMIAEGAPVRSRTHATLLRQLLQRERLTLAQLLRRPEVSGSSHWQVVGTVADALVEIRRWHAAQAIDGFIALPGGSLQSLALCCDELVPALADLGLFRHSYRSSTLRGHLGLAETG
ncbi:NtaA/DmoA family FMN-dependent monooxygenase [Halopseudomonas maritima]|uniref:NtaA/DmoA family FMN-dependent monooxygenase n=1 Tax=Halopseudomonas maritima TaxID=2918528 RepID=UPI001EEB0793|nr:NtaA/DmoA family FMN-dependent monooxygenase [Halopseudomonas maritima]UJJ29996.1 NtaA/DmoA family FMN-dependent monooxygenase [Halopseudomonas maritima]